MTYQLINIPPAYKPHGFKHRPHKPKGFNKALFLFEFGIKNPQEVRRIIISHYYALADKKGLTGKKRRNNITSRKLQLKKVIPLAQKLVK